MNQATSQTPLCIDLDGTLILSDLLLESLLLLLKRNPIYVLLLPVWLMKGKSALKAQIAKRVHLNPFTLPYNLPFLEWLYTQQQLGREMWLCTASNYRLADLVAAHIPIFMGVLASSDDINLSGRTKAKQLVNKFGEKGFDYCGNARVDLAVWQVSKGAIAVNCGEHLGKEAGKLAELRSVFPKASGILKPTLKALRPYQWAKNMLIFVPLLTSHKLFDNGSFEQAFLGFLAYGFCASSAYMLDDMLDLEDDRQHAIKCKRPFAAGKLSLAVGFLLIPLLLLAAALAAINLPQRFWLMLAGYYVLTLAYSLSLKHIVLIDIVALAGLSISRIAAGAMAITVPLSFWLLLFAIFLFLSLALVKRYAELDSMKRQGKLKADGCGYHIDDLPILYCLGTASGYLCVLVFALFINSSAAESLYRHPQALWVLCVLLFYWIRRVWLQAHRGNIQDDPVLFAMKDRISLVVGLLATIAVSLAV